MMNKFIKKKSRLLKIIAIFALLLCVVVYACQDEFGEPFDAQENARAIEYAKSWYNMNKPSDLAFRSSNGKVEIRMKPEWKNAFSKKNGKYETVESDLLTFGMFHFVHPKCMEKYNETGDMKYLRSYSRIVFRTDRKTNETVGFLMTQVPDLKFLEDTKFKPFKKSHYLDRDSKFGGWFLFHNLDGSFANGWVYENGKITGRINYFDIDSVDFSFRTLQCYEEMWYLNMWECPYWYTGGEDGYQYYCSLISSTYIGSTYFCEDDGTGEGGIDGGGGSGPSYPPTAPSQVTLSGSTCITIMDSYNLSVSISPSNFDCKSVEFKINNQYTLQNSISTTCSENAKKAGYWTIKAIVNGTYESNEINVEVQFPDAGTISSNSTVINAMSSAWETTKSAASSSDRQEYGFWIFVNTTTMSYECGVSAPGSYVSGCVGTHASVTIGPSGEQPSATPLSGGKYAVAHFHTHTPLTYCPSNVGRDPVGPSPGDISVLTSSDYGVPGLVYDYFAIYYPQYNVYGIMGGHNLHASAKVYTYSVNRRETPPF